MEMNEAAQVLLSTIEDHIGRYGSARYKDVVREFEEKVGNDWTVPGNGGRPNLSPEVRNEFNQLPEWHQLEWKSGKQRWYRKEV